jgi:hypothetical protein
MHWEIFGWEEEPRDFDASFIPRNKRVCNYPLQVRRISYARAQHFTSAIAKE